MGLLGRQTHYSIETLHHRRTTNKLMASYKTIHTHSNRSLTAGWDVLSFPLACCRHSVQLVPTLLCNYFGLRDVAFSWCRSYMAGHTQQIRVGECILTSGTSSISGVPQGLVLGLMLYSLYTHPLQTILKRHNVCCHKFADDNDSVYVLHSCCW